MKNSAWKQISLACAMSGLLFSASAYAANVSYDAKYNGHCYKIVDTGTTWGQARAACERQGGHLVTITSSQEQSVVASLLRNKGRKNNYWLGGLKSGSRWQWITGESFSYSHWSAGQPDNFQGRENCLSMYRNRNPYAYNNLGEWNDAAPDGVCNNEPFFGAANFGYICEWDSDPNANTNSVDGRLKGDVNGDGKVDKSDMNMLDQYIVGLRSSLPCPRNADMNGDGRHTITDVSQLARLCPLAGDVNGDGKIDYSDAEMLKQYIIGDRPSLPYPKNADANEDGEITVADVTKIVAIINPTPVTPPNPVPVPNPDPVPEKYVVSTNGATLALRSGPGTNYSIKTRIPNGSGIDVYSINNGWADCSYNGQRGYASAQYLKPWPGPVPVTNKISEALSWVNGNVRKRIGSGQCVALIQAYARQLGLNNPISSGNACDYATKPLQPGWTRVQGGTPQPGDILVYVGAKYGHVAIYIGGNESFHQNMAGKYVEKKVNWPYNKQWYSNAEKGTKRYWGYIRPNI